MADDVALAELTAALSALQRGREVAESMSELDAAFDRECETVRNGIFQSLSSGGVLDPALAVQAWMQLYAVHNLRKRLTQVVSIGKTASYVLKPATQEEE